MGSVTISDINNSMGIIAGIIGSGAVIGGFALFIGRFILKDSLKKALDPFNDKIKDLEKARIEQHIATQNEIGEIQKELHKNSLNTMKNTICNDNIPLPERLEVGREYIEKGGNGAVKIYVHKLEEQYEKKLQKEEKL